MDEGMLRVSLAEIAVEDTPVPIATEVDEGTIPEETSVPERVKVGRTLEDSEALAEGVTLPVPVGRGAERLTEPETVVEGRIPDDTRPDEKSDATLDAMLLISEVGIGRGTDAVGRLEAVIAEERADSALETRLDTTLGRVEPVGTTETTDDRRLESSETTDGRIEGRIPDADGEAVIVAETGAVGFTDPELGMMPVGNPLVSSDTTEERIEGKLTSPELAETPSEVGMAPEGEASLVGVAEAEAISVPSAVVMPIVIPPEGVPLEGTAPVGITPLLGRMPDSTAEVAVGSALPKREDRREPTRPADVVGCTMSDDAGKRPVDATDVGTASELCRSDESRPPVGCTISEAGGRRPVDAT
jgi:hypothetical protein